MLVCRVRVGETCRPSSWCECCCSLKGTASSFVPRVCFSGAFVGFVKDDAKSASVFEPMTVTDSYGCLIHPSTICVGGRDRNSGRGAMFFLWGGRAGPLQVCVGPPAIRELSTHELREGNENSSVVRIAIMRRAAPAVQDFAWEGPSCVPHPRPAAVCELVSITTNVCSWQSRACFRTDDGDGQLSIICGAGKELRPCRHDLLVRRFGLPCLVACLKFACWPAVLFCRARGQFLSCRRMSLARVRKENSRGLVACRNLHGTTGNSWALDAWASREQREFLSG